MDYYVRNSSKLRIFRVTAEKSLFGDEAHAFRLSSIPVQQAKNGVRGRETRKSRDLPHNSGCTMGSSYRRGSKSGRSSKRGGGQTLDDVLRELRQKKSSAGDYRERSLKIHGLICAKCGREFDHKNRHLLTVHHKDGNHRNNPPDGSNWENLCIYCHEDEHSRGMLGDYWRKDQPDDQ